MTVETATRTHGVEVVEPSAVCSPFEQAQRTCAREQATKLISQIYLCHLPERAKEYITELYIEYRLQMRPIENSNPPSSAGSLESPWYLDDQPLFNLIADEHLSQYFTDGDLHS